jgi:uncharacterized protein
MTRFHSVHNATSRYRSAPASIPVHPLKLHATVIPASNTFNAYGDGYVEVNAVRHERSILVMPDRPVIEWPVACFEALSADSFRLIAELDPELVVFGSGARIRFPHPRLLAPLIDRGIGVETMDMHAACRTYNILMAEGRRVAAALLIEAPLDLARAAH